MSPPFHNLVYHKTLAQSNKNASGVDGSPKEPIRNGTAENEAHSYQHEWSYRCGEVAVQDLPLE